MLLAVKDIALSRKFYEDVFGAVVTEDFGRNIALDIGIALQELELWKEFIGGRPVVFGNNATEIYFEEQDFDGFVKRLSTFNVDYVHKIVTHDWGQRVVRIYDPDKHIIEIGESLVTVCKRFYESGMSIDEISEKTMMRPDFIKEAILK